MIRRSFLAIGAGAAITGWTRIYAFSSDFWNKKDPSEWTPAEVDQLTNKSPWAKDVVVTAPARGGGMDRGGGNRYPGGGYPGGGYPGGGYPGGIGFPGGRTGRRRGGVPAQGQSYKGVVRWESAKPILDALKTPLPDGMANHYVISVGGIPLNSGRRQYQQSPNNNSQPDQNALDRLKAVTLLLPKDKRDLQPGVVVQQPAGFGNIYFGFSRDLVTLRPEDKEVTFTTQFGAMQIKAKFNLKDMMYRGQLAV